MIFDRLKEIIAEQFSVSEDSITMNTSFEDDLFADDLDFVELSMALEEEFDVPEPTDEDVAGFITVGDIVRFVSAKID